ncbi:MULTISPECIES: hypothetical protein [Bradyrhizobium]|uniref:hypothetical protein n=1 Tax=Bradyrhizobium TaxID=374 RepID=UPI0009EE65F7|nr:MULTISPECIES: hypothetical protein [Bradyrhizobium]
MTSTRLAITAIITVGLLAAPFAAEAKSRSVRHHATRVVAPSYGSVGVSAAAQPRTYGSSGPAIGTVTAPSIGTYNWPSVGVTNAVPTWSNTNPPIR